MKLTIEHLAPYLPYGLKGQIQHDMREDFYDCEWVGDESIFEKGTIWQYAGYADNDLMIPLGEGDFSGFLIRNGNSYTSVGNSIKPILRPLSDLDILIDGRKNTPLMDEIKNLNPSLSNYQVLELGDNHRYCDFVLLIKNHYDVFGLIEKGLAIDINTLK